MVRSRLRPLWRQSGRRRFSVPLQGVWYSGLMTKQLAHMLERVRKWPAHRQADVVSVLKSMERAGTSVYKLSTEERRLIREGINSPLVSDADLKKFRNRHKRRGGA